MAFSINFDPLDFPSGSSGISIFLDNTIDFKNYNLNSNPCLSSIGCYC